MLRMINKILKPVSSDRRGVTAVEYALMGALIAAGIVTAVTTLKTNLVTTFGTISSAL
jgi:pilus assembly protein Flp/PilA